jgi:hypothetical protein
MTDWVSADAWARRELGDDTYLMVSRTSILGGHWHWRRHVRATGELISYGPVKIYRSYGTKQEAMSCADKAVHVLMRVA